MTDAIALFKMSMAVVVDEDELDTLIEGAHTILELPDEVVIEDVRRIYKPLDKPTNP